MFYKYYIFTCLKLNIIPHLHNLLLFQCDVTRSLNRYEARSKLFIDQGRTTLYRLLRYIGQYRCDAVFTHSPLSTTSAVVAIQCITVTLISVRLPIKFVL